MKLKTYEGFIDNVKSFFKDPNSILEDNYSALCKKYNVTSEDSINSSTAFQIVINLTEILEKETGKTYEECQKIVHPWLKKNHRHVYNQQGDAP